MEAIALIAAARLAGILDIIIIGPISLKIVRAMNTENASLTTRVQRHVYIPSFLVVFSSTAGSSIFQGPYMSWLHYPHESWLYS
jgi:hypothetical protein